MSSKSLDDVLNENIKKSNVEKEDYRLFLATKSNIVTTRAFQIAQLVVTYLIAATAFLVGISSVGQTNNNFPILYLVVGIIVIAICAYLYIKGKKEANFLPIIVQDFERYFQWKSKSLNETKKQKAPSYKKLSTKGEKINEPLKKSILENVALMTIVGVILGGAISLFVSTNTFNMTQPYLQKTEPDLSFWLGGAEKDGVRVILIWHLISKHAANLGAVVEICMVNKGKIDSGPINIFLQSPSWAQYTSAYLANVGNHYDCTQINLRHKKCFENGNCDENVINPGLTELKFKITCVACEQHEFDKTFDICIQSQKQSCSQYE